MRIDIRVNGTPKAQPRPRAFARKVGAKFHARVFDDGSAEQWKSLVVAAARPQRPETPIAVGVLVAIDFFLPRPKRLMRKKDPVEVVPAIGKPDADNLGKAVLDALTQDGWIVDDALVFALTLRKFFHRKDGRPGATITLVVP